MACSIYDEKIDQSPWNSFSRNTNCRPFIVFASQDRNDGAWIRGERLLQTHILSGQDVQIPSSDWTRATALYILSDLNMSL